MLVGFWDFFFFVSWGGDSSCQVANFLLLKTIIYLQVKDFLKNAFLREHA